MSFIKGNIIGVRNDDIKDKLANIFDEYFEDIVRDEDVTFENAVNNNMIISYAYGLFDNQDLLDKVFFNNIGIIRSAIIENIFETRPFIDPYLINTAYSTYFVWKNTKCFEKFLFSLNEYIINLTDGYIDYFYKNSDKLDYGFFSLSSGLSGICNYLLEFGSKYQVTIEKIIKILIHIVDEKSEINSRIHKQIDMTENYLEFGLRNGISGILSVMVKSYTYGIIIEGQKEAVIDIINALKKFVIYKDNEPYWPGILQLDSKNNFEKNINIKETLGYGSIGIARILYLAGKCLEDEILTAFSEKIIITKSRKIVKEFVLINGSLINGYCGVLCLFDAMDCNEARKSYFNINNELLIEIISLYNKETKSTFELKEIFSIFNRIKEVQILDNYSILEGNSGIILSLLSTFSSANKLFNKYLGIEY